MNRTTIMNSLTGLGLVAAAILVLASSGTPADTRSVIVQGDDLQSVARAVLDAGGAVTHELGIINAVAAELTAREIDALTASVPTLRVHENHTATVAATTESRSTRTKDPSADEAPELPTLDGQIVAIAENEDSGWTGLRTADMPDSETEPSDDFLFSDELDFGALLEELYKRTHPYADYPTLVSADRLHDMGITGRHVTVAVLDTGTVSWLELMKDSDGNSRLHVQYDAIKNTVIKDSWNSDGNGHGTHVASVAVNSALSPVAQKYNSIAPDAGLVVVKAFGLDGSGTYADVVRGIDWIVKNKDRYDIRVLNLSFSAPVNSNYWDDLVNQAVMRAWQAGIVVVVSAGNSGPDPMTIGVPGNVPYVVTVGAMTDNYTPDDRSDDRLTSFSATGPTFEAFVKPDLVAPGGHLSSLMEFGGEIAQDHPEFHDKGLYFEMSGTSQAAAVITGVAALVLSQDPSLEPDDVKCRLMAAAHPAVNPDGTLAYSVFQQGAGMVDAYDAVFNQATDCANRGLDIARDLEGTQHFAGYARQNTDGEYYIEGLEGSSMLWSESSLWSESMLWSETALWSDSMLWSESSLWSESMLWSESSLWSESDLTSSSIAINAWVDQE